MALIGLFLFIFALRKSEFIIYKLLVDRSKMLWGENVNTFYIYIVRQGFCEYSYVRRIWQSKDRHDIMSICRFAWVRLAFSV